MMAESVTVVFSYFAIGVFGFVFVDTIALFASVLILLGVMIPMLFLSPKRAKGMLKSLFLSLALEIFLLVFFILHFPTVAWISPGLYAVIIADVLMGRRAIQLRKGR